MFGSVIFCFSFRVFFIFQIAQYVLAVPEPEPGFSHLAKKTLTGGVEVAKSSPVVPVQIRGALIVGSAVVKGVEEYRKTGDIESAGAVAAKSGMNDGIKAVNGIPGAKLAMGVAKDVAAGKSMSTVISHSGKEALNIVPGKKLASIGLSAARAMKEGKSIEDIVIQSDQGTLAQNVEDQPMFNQIQNNSELDENALNLYPQTLSQASNGNAEANSQRPAEGSKSRKSRSTESVINQQRNCICEPAISGLKSIRKRSASVIKRAYSKLRRTSSNLNNENHNAPASDSK